ncbi:PhnD/SsuA/transferrin family substrate-binding protein [Halobacteria archaeon AArc-curdl1]|uniref:PhnD/SsuA/transferrin family substrate-binding protein n=1 Tax=Natronosalvus hydrolyticus TaxID=2979988 RepID=A0AAP2ZB96_9EURY|nr:PhnD/SsuA/transferrin family substrate-binding protein [Halobacteria archaeon AArc-curdl1]
MSEQSRWTNKRRTFLKGAGVTATAGLAGCLGDLTGGDDETISWVMNPAEESIDIETQYSPLFNYLEDEAGVEIEGIQTSDYSSTVLEMQRGSGDFADTSPGAVAQIPDDIDVVGMRLAFGAERYFSLIATTPDNDIDSLEDLEGKHVATASSTSVSGTLFPMLMLSQAGLDTGGAPDGNPNDFEWSPSDHDTAREQLIENPNVDAAAAGAFSLADHIPQEQFDEMSQDFVDISVEYGDAGTRDPELQLLGVSDPIPRAPIVVRSDWDDPIREELEELMIEAEPENFEHDPEELVDDLGLDPEILDADPEDLTEEQLEDLETFEDHELWFNGIEPATHDDYQPVVDLLDELGLSPEDI